MGPRLACILFVSADKDSGWRLISNLSHVDPGDKNPTRRGEGPLGERDNELIIIDW